MERCLIRLVSVWVRSCRVLDTWRRELMNYKAYLLFEMLNPSRTGVISQRELF
jgi:hypothetical protein